MIDDELLAELVRLTKAGEDDDWIVQMLIRRAVEEEFPLEDDEEPAS